MSFRVAHDLPVETEDLAAEQSRTRRIQLRAVALGLVLVFASIWRYIS